MTYGQKYRKDMIKYYWGKFILALQHHSEAEKLCLDKIRFKYDPRAYSTYQICVICDRLTIFYLRGAMISNMIETSKDIADRAVGLFQTGFSHIYVKRNINI